MESVLRDFVSIFPGLEVFSHMSPLMGFTRVFLIVFGFVLCYLGYKNILEPLIMVPMGIGMAMVNAGMLMMPDITDPSRHHIGTMFLNSMLEKPNEIVDAFQVYFLQPIYTLTFSNGLIACLVFIGIGSITDLSFFIANPRMSLLLAICAELGSILTFPIAMSMGFNAKQSAAIAIIGGADGPMVLFASLQLAKELFVPISIVAYIYLSIVYAGYPYLIKLLVPRYMRGVTMEQFSIKEVSPFEKIVFSFVAGTVLCLLFPVAAPLFVSFFLGVIIRESQITRYIYITDNVILSGATMFLGFTLGCLLSADIVVDPKMFKMIILGFIALFLSGLGGLFGGLIAFWVSKGTINPLLGIAGVSCVPTTAKVAHKCAQEVNPQAYIMMYAMGPCIAGVITTAIITACYVTLIPKSGL
ncbi:MAG: sodium ion-translocating decarboxylase subunit beta [Desulfobacterota bacterium]|nr:sodium ion-translocating decarboxylase subunit beta [Thermodesulfobacteriota bacterium]